MTTNIINIGFKKTYLSSITHPSQRKVSETFSLPRSICDRMLAHLKNEYVDTIEIDKQLIYEYWNDNNNVSKSNRNKRASLDIEIYQSGLKSHIINPNS